MAPRAGRSLSRARARRDDRHSRAARAGRPRRAGLRIRSRARPGAPRSCETCKMELARLLRTDERPTKRARQSGHGETIYMQQSAALESGPRATWRPQFRHWSANAGGTLEFECRWPSCDHRSFTVEADTGHLRSHVVRKQSGVFRTRVVAQLRAVDTDVATPRCPSAVWRLPATVLSLPSAPAAPAPSPPPLSPPCSAASDNESTHQQWRTSRPRTGNRIPLDRRTSDGGASARFKCGRPGCSYIALRRSHLIQHELTHSGERPFGTPHFALSRAMHIVQACSADCGHRFSSV